MNQEQIESFWKNKNYLQKEIVDFYVMYFNNNPQVLWEPWIYYNIYTLDFKNLNYFLKIICRSRYNHVDDISSSIDLLEHCNA